MDKLWFKKALTENNRTKKFNVCGMGVEGSSDLYVPRYVLIMYGRGRGNELKWQFVRTMQLIILFIFK